MTGKEFRNWIMGKLKAFCFYIDYWTKRQKEKNMKRQIDKKRQKDKKTILSP